MGHQMNFNGLTIILTIHSSNQIHIHSSQIRFDGFAVTVQVDSNKSTKLRNTRVRDLEELG